MLFKTHKVELELLDPVLPKQELRRRAILPAAPKSELEMLAGEAETLLGYSTLRRHVNAPGPLAATLLALEITVLNHGEVKRYKEYMQHELKNKLSDVQDCWWTTAAISDYMEPIPEFVLRKAVAVKKRLPNVTFSIDYLRVGFKSADPFLIAAHWSKNRETKEEYIIEVWDEPEFEAKL